MSALTVPRREYLRNTGFAAVLGVVLGAAALTWAEVVDRLRDPAPVEVRGSASAIVWANRVFRSEAELARWLRARGVSYEHWAKKHPAAVATLRGKTRVAHGRTAASDVAVRDQSPRRASPPAAQNRTGAEAVAEAVGGQNGSRLTVAAFATPLLVTLALLLSLGAIVPLSTARRLAPPRLGWVFEAAARHRIYLVGTALSIAVGGLVGAVL